MLMIAKKYLVQPSEIYKLNKKANDGISEGMVLYIPQPIKSQDIIAKKKEKREKEALALLERKKEREEREALAEAKAKEDVIVAEAEEKKTEYGRREEIGKLKMSDKKQFIEHKVASGDTLNGLSRKYGVSVEEIQTENASVLKNGLQAGQIIKMPVAQNLFIEEPEVITTSVTPNKTNNEFVETHSEISHKVVQGETLFSISRKYGVSVADIKNENENLLKNGLQSGQILKVKSNTTVVINNSNNSEKIDTVNKEKSNIYEDNPSNNEFSIVKHIVEPKETLYSISKKYGVSVDEIKTQNENILAKGLQSGQEISIKVKK